MIVHARTPAPSLADHRAAARDCLPTLALTVPSFVVLYLAVFVIDTSPHLPPNYPHSVGLTVAALAAMTANGWALAVRYRQRLAWQRRRADSGGRHRAV